MINLIIDDIKIEVKEGTSVLQAAEAAGNYIPRLCFHPDLPSSQQTRAGELVYRGDRAIKSDVSDKEFEGCQLCTVEIDGKEGFATACTTMAEEGMVVRSKTAQIQELRQQRLALILARHPHVCLTCAQREGCNREPCSLKVAVTDRCCPKLGRCELQKVAEYVGIKTDIPRYVFRNLPVVKNAPLVNQPRLLSHPPLLS